MADKRCNNGHFIDETWDICPYCPPDEAAPEIPVSRGPRTAESPRLAEVPRTTVAPSSPPPSRRDPVTSADAPPMDRTVAVQKVDVAAQPKRYVVAWLIGLSGPTRGEAYPVRMGRNVIGRDRRSDIVVNDEQASSHHADLVFRPEERRYILMDHNSTNGTYVNEGEIEPRRDLTRDDIVRIGAHKFLFMPLCRDGVYWDEEGILR